MYSIVSYLNFRDEGENMNLFKRMLGADPTKYVVENAVNILRDPHEIRLFVNGYIDYLRKDSDDGQVRKYPLEVALWNVQLFLGFYGYDSEEYQRWIAAVPEMKHTPAVIFSR